MTEKFETETRKAVAYTASYKDFDTEHFNWDEAVISLFAKNATYSKLFSKLELRQGCRDENGFYPNYIYAIPTEDCDFDVDSLLTDLGFRFKKEEITLKEIHIEWNENVDDYLIVED